MILIMLFSSGCSIFSGDPVNAVSQTHRLKDSGKLLTLDGTYHEDILTIRVNGFSAIRTPYEGGNKDFVGFFNDREVFASCFDQDSVLNCVVSIDNEKAGTLQFGVEEGIGNSGTSWWLVLGLIAALIAAVAAATADKDNEDKTIILRR